MPSSRAIIKATDHLINPSYSRRTEVDFRLEPRHLQLLRDLYGAGWRSEFGRQLEFCSIRGFRPQSVKPAAGAVLESMSFSLNTSHWEQLQAMWSNVDAVASGLIEYLAGGAVVPWPKAGAGGVAVENVSRTAGTVTASGNRVRRSLSLELWVSDKADRLRGVHPFSDFISRLIRRASGEVVLVASPPAEDIRDKVKVPVSIWLTPAERDALDKVSGGRRRFVQSLVKEKLANSKHEWL